MPHYFILDTPAASPAKCGLCGYAGSERKYLDPRLDFEFYGSLIFCEACVGTMANDFGFLQPAQARSLESRVEEAERELITLRSAVLKLEESHDALSDLHALLGVPVPPSVAEYDDSVQDLIPEHSNSPVSREAEREGSGDSEVDESPSEQRSDDISALIASADDLLSL